MNMTLIPFSVAISMICVRHFQFQINVVINNYHTYTVLNSA